MTKLAQAWRESKLFRELAGALKAMAELPTIAEDQRQELREIAEWTLRHADYVDSLTYPKWMIEQFKKPPWQYTF